MRLTPRPAPPGVPYPPGTAAAVLAHYPTSACQATYFHYDSARRCYGDDGSFRHACGRLVVSMGTVWLWLVWRLGLGTGRGSGGSSCWRCSGRGGGQRCSATTLLPTGLKMSCRLSFL